MNANEVLATLKKLGKPTTAAIYRRHGAGDDVFGVLTSEISKLQKKIKVDHPLALALWKTGNAEARILALQVADPQKLTRAEADAFAKGGGSRFIGSYLSSLVARTPMADKMMRAWIASPSGSLRESGYGVLAHRLKEDPDAVSDADVLAVITTIETKIHGAPNLARHAMNNALIAVGVFKPSVRKQVIAAAKRIGKVEVDHGETACKTPDAVAYIEKAAKRRA